MEQGKQLDGSQIEGTRVDIKEVSSKYAAIGNNPTININIHNDDLQKELSKPKISQLPFEPIMNDIPEGYFLMGSDAASGFPKDEHPQSNIFLPAYQIGKFPITNSEYAEFLNQVNHHPPNGWFGSQPPKGKENHPVVHVSWLDAVTYCEWLFAMTNREYRLPTEAEWEKAARGENGRLYPWGNEWEEDKCNHFNAGTSAVGEYKTGASIYSCQDLVGNVREWTSTAWGNHLRRSNYPYPYRVDDGRENPDKQLIYRIIRGSDFTEEQSRHRCARRTWYKTDSLSKNIGFRIARTVEKSTAIVS